jgi:ATP-dependent metalloprotease
MLILPYGLQARQLLKTHDREHHRLANALIEFETLTAEEMQLVMAGKTLPNKFPAPA